MLFTLKIPQLLKNCINTVWDFMSYYENLTLITPKYIGLNILADKENIKKNCSGQIIDYSIIPIIGIKIHWVTKITQVSNHHYFVDEQRFSRNAFWHHKHFIKEVTGAIKMTDILNYKVPIGFIGNIINTLFISHKIKEIFDYCFNKLEQIFNHEK